MIYVQKNKQSIETAPEETQMLYLLDKIESAVLSMLKELKTTYLTK